MCSLFINDLDAGAGRMGGTTQYTVNNQMVNATLMNIADNPTNVQLPGVYNNEEIPRVPIICTGNDFSTLYAPLIRDGRMEKFYWNPTREDRIGICGGIFREDDIGAAAIDTLLKYGNLLVEEQENVKRVQLADAYLDGAELAGVGGSSLPEEVSA